MLCIIILGVLLSGIWFGMNVVLDIISSKAKIEFIGKYSVLFSALLPTIFILKCRTLQLWNFRSITDWRCWVVISVTVIVTALIVSINEVSDLTAGKELLWYAMDGVFMEVPQRMMMQSFICILLSAGNLNLYISPFITAIVWCISIGIQCLIMKRKFDKSVLYELLSSFVFSMGVGIVLVRSEFIGFTMVAHFLERILSTMMRKKRLAITR